MGTLPTVRVAQALWYRYMRSLKSASALFPGSCILNSSAAMLCRYTTSEDIRLKLPSLDRNSQDTILMDDPRDISSVEAISGAEELPLSDHLYITLLNDLWGPKSP